MGGGFLIFNSRLLLIHRHQNHPLSRSNTRTVGTHNGRNLRIQRHNGNRFA